MSSDLDRGAGFDRFTARDREDARLVSARHTSCALGAVEACALGSARGLISELGVSNVRRLDGKEKLDGDAVGDELVVREKPRAGV